MSGAVWDQWRIETGLCGFDDEGFACLRHLRSQCGQDFYERSDPLIYSFLKALAENAAAPRETARPNEQEAS